MEVNVLVLSSGTRNKIIEYFKENLVDENGNRMGKVIATDMSNLAPSIYEADKFYIVPGIFSDGYIEKILEICKKENISGVLSLIDPELSLLAKNEAKFAELGVKIVGSPYELCEMSLDKIRMFNWLTENGYKTAKSYDKREEFIKDYENNKIDFPVFVKPIKGSASVAINKVENMETLDLLFKNSDNLMIQEFLKGQEFGVDVYIDLISGEICSIFAKKKLLMRAGETDKSVSFKDEKLFALVKDFVKSAGYRGQIDIDIFEIDGEYYISEVNPRFGGGYPHAYESGCNHMKMIISNLKGMKNKVEIGNYDENIYMMKYNEVKIIR